MRVYKKIFESKPEGTTKKILRPRMRWLNNAENDLQGLTEKQWRQRVNLPVIKEAKVLKVDCTAKCNIHNSRLINTPVSGSQYNQGLIKKL
jgi:hypothetical protein